MVAMSASITLKGHIKFSMKKLFTGGEMTHSTYSGPGEVLLAPPALGDIVPIRLDGEQAWSLGRDAHLAHTSLIKLEVKSQGLAKAMFSGEGLFVSKATGKGVLFITSLGAIVQKDVSRSQSNRNHVPLGMEELILSICRWHLMNNLSSTMTT